MDHKTFLSTLSVEQREWLTKRSDIMGLLHLLGHWGCILVCGLLIVLGVPLWSVLMVVQGVLLVFLFTLLHETTHKTPFRSDWLNTVIGHVCGLLLFLPATWFRYFHLAHHRFTQVPGKDPELETPKPATPKQYLSHMSGIPVWIGHAKTLWLNATGRNSDAFIPKNRHRSIRVEAACYLCAYALILGLSVWFADPMLVFVWLMPALLGQPFLRLYLLAEHGRCPKVANMFENTRTTFTNKVVRALAWNMPYHAEHHSYPSVPFHKLPEFHGLIARYLQETEDGYVAFNRKYVREALDRPA